VRVGYGFCVWGCRGPQWTGAGWSGLSRGRVAFGSGLSRRSGTKYKLSRASSRAGGRCMQARIPSRAIPMSTSEEKPCHCSSAHTYACLWLRHGLQLHSVPVSPQLTCIRFRFMRDSTVFGSGCLVRPPQPLHRTSGPPHLCALPIDIGGAQHRHLTLRRHEQQVVPHEAAPAVAQQHPR